jgi:hypothetical protein
MNEELNEAIRQALLSARPFRETHPIRQRRGPRRYRRKLDKPRPSGAWWGRQPWPDRPYERWQESHPTAEILHFCPNCRAPLHGPSFRMDRRPEPEDLAHAVIRAYADHVYSGACSGSS